MENKEKQPLALVTGGGSGIGLAIAKKFTENGIRTIILGRDPEKLKSAKKMLGPLCEEIRFDLDRLSTLPGLVKDLAARFGRVTILVNNAGVNLKKEFTEVTDDEFQQVLLTNVAAVFAISRELAKQMLENGNGSIINISSMASQYGIPKVIAYSASKSAIEGMTRAMAVDLSPRGIRVNCIAPGFIETEMSSKALNGDQERMQKVLSRTPMGTLGRPEDIAEAAFFFATASSRFITGVVLPVDGGNSIGF
ncbi:MAG: SDR family oxidoreductase [Bacteroidota bacterium]|nr:SDR family oxidoreductase [Bacteroidota bacterium]